MTLDTYAHVFADLEEEGPLPAAQMIEEARDKISRERDQRRLSA